ALPGLCDGRPPARRAASEGHSRKEDCVIDPPLAARACFGETESFCRRCGAAGRRWPPRRRDLPIARDADEVGAPRHRDPEGPPLLRDGGVGGLGRTPGTAIILLLAFAQNRSVRMVPSHRSML